MPCHVAKSRSVSSRRRQRLQKSALSPLPLLAMRNLETPTEREAHAFLIRATGKRDAMWRLLDVRRHASTLLCVVRWVNSEEAKPFSLAEVSLTEMAVCWRDYATAEAACAELDRRCTKPSQ